MTVVSFLAGLLPEPQRTATLLLLALIGLDWIVGVVAAIARGKFDARVIGDQLKKVVTQVFGLLALEVATTSQFGSSGGVTVGAYMAVVAGLVVQNVADLRQKVGFLLGTVSSGIPAQTITSVLSPQPAKTLVNPGRPLSFTPPGVAGEGRAAPPA